MDYIIQLDKEITLFINSLHNNFSDYFMWLVSAKYTWLPLYLFLIYKIYVREKNIKTFSLVVLFAIVSVTLSDQISVHLFKNVFMRLRPCHCPEIKDIVHIVKDHCGGQYGFISSHSSNAFSVTVFLSLYFSKKQWTIILISTASLIAISRVFLGVHYLGDILAGAIVGSLIAVFSFTLFKKTLKRLVQEQ